VWGRQARLTGSHGERISASRGPFALQQRKKPTPRPSADGLSMATFESFSFSCYEGAPSGGLLRKIPRLGIGTEIGIDEATLDLVEL